MIPKLFSRSAASAAAVAATLALVLPTSASAASPPGAAALVTDPASLVNPVIGTGDFDNTFPGADVPFGMVQWSPDTPTGKTYNYADSTITGYSLTHLSGTGCGTNGDIPVLPTVGAITSDPSADTQPLDHSAEVARAGYYEMASGGITTALTATTRSGMAKFTFPASSSASLLFKLSGTVTQEIATGFQVVSSHEVEGSVTDPGLCGGNRGVEAPYTVYFDMVFSQPIAGYGTYLNGQVSSGSGALTENSAVTDDGAYLTFNTTSSQTVLAKIGISYVSIANAALNRRTENPGWNFGGVTAKAHAAWNSMLDKIQIGGGTPAEQTIFYTALYHSLLHPNVFSDVNGEYVGFNGKVYHLTGGQRAQYANFSGWDVYRSEIQLLALLAPRQTSDIAASMLNDYAQGGDLPKWTDNNGENYDLIGDPADSILADAYAFGARDFDASQALTDMEAQASIPNNTRPGLNYYEEDGYLPIDGTYGCCNFNNAVSTQEEYDVADNSVAELASALGQRQVAAAYATRANNWQNVFNPGTGFIQPKQLNGQFQAGFNPTTQNGFAEADSYIYTAELPFDLRGIIEAEGGSANWADYLNGLTSSVTAMGPTQIQMADEPSYLIPWEYDYAGQPYQTQQVVREIQTQLWSVTPGGLPGNDDLGATSSWYVWSALGFYPETPGTATVAIGSPLFPAIVIHDGSKTITETAPQAADNAPYVQSLTMNGSPWARAYLPASLLRAGGSLDWTLATTPDTSWAAAASDAPPSDTAGLLPAIGYATGNDPAASASGGPVAAAAPGGTATGVIGVQSLTRSAQNVSWTMTPQAGSGIPAAGGTINVAGEAKTSAALAIPVPGSVTDGQYTIQFQFRTANGVAMPDVVLTLAVSG